MQFDHGFAVAFLFYPLLIASVLALFRSLNESAFSRLVQWGAWGQVLLILLLWTSHFSFDVSRELNFGSLFQVGYYSFEFILLFDLKARVFATLCTVLMWITVHYCRYYLHREQGFARFFRTLFLCNFAIQMIALAGTLDLLFIGWECLGISSFLLISFYRERTRPVINAFRIYIIYRICDLGLLMGAWLEHHEYSGAHSFLRSDPSLIHALQSQHPIAFLLLGILLLLATLGKSAQFPFSFWLPQAMEGPTPSTAIFYGALSIHAGAFLLLRTHYLWEDLWLMRVLIVSSGLISCGVSTLISRAQSNIKGQIAYASSAHVGLIFVEIGLGWYSLALTHLVLHALIRSYQLLASPSAVAHFLRHPVRDRSKPIQIPKMIQRLSVGEFFMEDRIQEWVIYPTLQCGRLLIRYPWAMVALVILGFVSTSSTMGLLIMAVGASLIGVAISGWKDRSWFFGLLSVLCISSTVASKAFSEVFWLSLSGVLPGALLWLIFRKKRAGVIGPTALFLSWLMLAGFPITPFFIGEDLILHHIVSEGVFPGVLLSIAFILNGVIFARWFVCRCWLKTRVF